MCFLPVHNAVHILFKFTFFQGPLMCLASDISRCFRIQTDILFCRIWKACLVYFMESIYILFVLKKKIKIVLRSDSRGFAYILLHSLLLFSIWFLFPKKFCCLYLKSDILLSSDPSILSMEASWPDQLSITSDVVGFCTFFSHCPLPWREKRGKKQPKGQSSFYLQKNCKVEVSPEGNNLR